MQAVNITCLAPVVNLKQLFRASSHVSPDTPVALAGLPFPVYLIYATNIVKNTC